jgi:hypothetical protein
MKIREKAFGEGKRKARAAFAGMYKPRRPAL